MDCKWNSAEDKFEALRISIANRDTAPYVRSMFRLMHVPLLRLILMEVAL